VVACCFWELDLILAKDREMTDSFFDDLKQMRAEGEKKLVDAFWKGHSRFQVSHRVLSFKGRAESLILIYLFQLANSYSNVHIRVAVIELKVKAEKIAQMTGLSPQAVYPALATLQAAGCIRIVPRTDPITKLTITSIYLLLHPTTGEPMYSTGGEYGICASNWERPYLTLLKDSLPTLVQMTPAGRAVYLSAMAEASVRVRTSLAIRKQDWQKESLLARNAFGRGFLECLKKKLLTYSCKKQVLTLNDPATGKVSERWKYEHQRVAHDNPQWKFDLNKVSGEEWRATIERLLKHQFFVGQNGWTHATREVFCPFCKEPRSFSVNFGTAQYRCHAGKCGDAATGRLGQLVQRVLATTWRDAKTFIQEQMTTGKAA